MDEPGESAGGGSNATQANVASQAPLFIAPVPLIVRARSRSPSPVPSVDPKKDLWLSTVDGRYSCQSIPVRVGRFPSVETFFVHRDVLTKSKWFEKALCGGFKEAEDQVIDLPEEEPGIFHFVVAFLYEGRYEPIQPIVSALRSAPDKGKGKDEGPSGADAVSDSSSSSSSSLTGFSSNSSGEDAAFRNLQRHRRDHRPLNGKSPGARRVDCRCDRCAAISSLGRRCPHCGEFPGEPVSAEPRLRVRRLREQGMFLDGERVDRPTHRISPSEMQAWLMAYELNIDVYICAVRFLMDDLQDAVMWSTINMLESAGTEAAHIQVLRLCARLREGVPATDPLLAMVLARVGFLQTLMWKSEPIQTDEFLVANPELAALILRETIKRHESQDKFRNLPAMEYEFRGKKSTSRV